MADLENSGDSLFRMYVKAKEPSVKGDLVTVNQKDFFYHKSVIRLEYLFCEIYETRTSLWICTLYMIIFVYIKMCYLNFPRCMAYVVTLMNNMIILYAMMYYVFDYIFHLPRTAVVLVYCLY